MTSMLDTLAPLDEGQYPTGRYAETTRKLQQDLIARGYLAPFKADGVTSSADGWIGPRTKAALAAYQAALAAQPLPPKPFLASRRGKGLVKMGLGTAVGIAGLWWSGAEQIDVATVVEVGYELWGYVAGALEHWSRLVELAGLLVTALGFGQHVKGALKAEAPVALGRAHPPAGPDGVRGGLGALPPDAGTGTDARPGFWQRPRGRGPFLE